MNCFQSSHKIGVIGRTYKWVLKFNYENIPTWLNDINLFWDSDVTLITPEKIYDVYKIHKTTPVILSLRASNATAVGHLNNKVNRDNFNGYVMNAVHAVSRIIY